MMIMMVLGILFIYSSGISSTGTLVSDEYIYQIVWVVIGLILYFLLLMIDYSIIRNWSLTIYIICLALLVITLLIGRSVNGSRSWLGLFGFGIQPSEFTKLAAVLILARFFEDHRKQIRQLSVFFRGLAFALIPMGLVLIQPDLGTASVFLPLFLVIAFIAGVRKRYLMFIILYGVFTVVLGVLPVSQLYFLQHQTTLVQVLADPYLFGVLIFSFLLLSAASWIGYWLIKNEYFYWLGYFFIIITISLASSTLIGKVLKDYQIMRLIVFIDPSVDPQGNGWNIIQSVTAVGSGGFWGKGFLQGTQSHYRFLPQQSTDFIFSILAEEFGFVGSFLVILLFSIMIIRGLRMIFTSKDRFGALVITGVMAILFFHMFVNIGMAIGIMPITGIPLFFLSYGGSSLWTALIGLALVQNVYIHRYRY
jgi:rod shape determining protein RodA